MYKNTHRDPTGRYHFAESYLTEEQIRQVLNHYSDYIISALFIYHDKDVKETDEQQGKRLQELEKTLEETNKLYNTVEFSYKSGEKLYAERTFNCDDERKAFKRANITIPKQRLAKLAKKRVNLLGEINHLKDERNDVGKLKTPHWHILLKTYDDHTACAVRKWFYRFRITERKEIDGAMQDVLVTTLNQLTDSVGSSRDYLTHRNDPDKYQYPVQEVKEWGDGWSTFNHASRTCDDCMVIIDRMNSGEHIRQLIREYGKDFLYHIRTYEYAARLILRTEMQAYEEVQQADEISASGDHELIRKIDWQAVNRAAIVIEQFQKFMKEVNPLCISAMNYIENGK